MTRWIILTTIVLAIPTSVALSQVRASSNESRHAQALAVKQYWVAEFRQRWKGQRRTAQRQAQVIRALRAKTRTLKGSVRNLRSAMMQPSYGTHYLETNFLCIHAFEGNWDDPNAPYYGGLQMDWNFMETYGPEFLRAFGTADNWPVSVQIATAIKAYLAGRGFGPWPNTRRMCGI